MDYHHPIAPWKFRRPLFSLSLAPPRAFAQDIHSKYDGMKKDIMSKYDGMKEGRDVQGRIIKRRTS